jgi:zinc/manganese transport system ATP-binding protein
VRDEFPETLMLARDCLGWGPTAEVLTAANRLRARGMAESWAADPRTARARRRPAA